MSTLQTPEEEKEALEEFILEECEKGIEYQEYYKMRLVTS
jgi:hypothetical protein